MKHADRNLLKIDVISFNSLGDQFDVVVLQWLVFVLSGIFPMFIYKILDGKCARTIFTHELLTYAKGMSA